MKRICAFMLAVLLAFSVGGCGNKQKNNTGNKNYEKVKSGDEISIFSYKPDTFCPILSKNEANIQMLGIVYDGLISLSDSLYPEPGLAESWSVTDSGETWTIALRKDVKWHDGSKFDAEDVLYTVESIKNAEDSIYSYNVSNIKEIRANGSFELEIEVVEPWANFVNLLYFPIIKRSSGAIDSQNFKPIGTGAYRLEDRNEGNILYLVKNKDWWGGEAATDVITVKLLPDNDTALYAFSSGSIDMTIADDMNWGRFVDPASASHTYVPTPIFHFVGINHQNTVLGLPEIRKAMSLVLDREKMIDEVMTGYATASAMPIHPDWFMCGEKKLDSKQNIDLAKEILLKNAFESENGILTKRVDDEILRTEFKLIYNEENLVREELAKLIKENLGELGFNISLESMPFEEYQTRISEGDYDLFVGSYVISPNVDFSFVLGEGNLFGFQNDEMTNAINKLKTKYSISGIEEGYGTVIEKFEELNPVVGLFFENRIIVHNNRIKGEISVSYFDIYRGIEALRKEDAK